MNWINGQKYIPLLVGFGEPPLPPPPNDPMITEITEDDVAMISVDTMFPAAS